jgi:uncharacterized protein YbaA (DUF1428 family)
MAKTKGKYVDGFVLVVPKRNLAAYRKLATMAGKIWRKHGALDYKECIGDDLTPDMGGMTAVTFPKMAKAKAGEVVVFSYIVYKSRAHRDAVNAKVMKDPAMNDPQYKDKPMPFDMKRMAWGGFTVLVEA